MPARGRHTTAQLLNLREKLFLLDCGEGTQDRLRMAGVNMQRIARVFITHMHGDHYLGLMGIIGSMHLLGRTAPMEVYGPPELEEVVRIQLRAAKTYLKFPLHFHVVEHRSGALVYRDQHVVVTALALRHRVDATGYLFKEMPGPKRLRKEKVHLIPKFARNTIKQGEDLVLPDGSIIPNAELTREPAPTRSYAYCTDTAYMPELADWVRGVDLLYHEATFAQALASRAKETMHSTAQQAAMVARDAGVGQLLIGHFSSRYKTVDGLLEEARSIFPNTVAAEEGATYRVAGRDH